jgi:hypothetical protein
MIAVGFAVHEAEAEAGRACAICQTVIARGEPVGACPSCDAPYHADCWQENGGCGSYGCELSPSVVKEDGPAEGSSYWGQEDKACPACGKRIRLAALRCRHCGHVLPSRAPDAARPQGPPPTGAAAVILFVLALVPCSAPLALLVGGPALWLGRRRVRRWPATRRAMAITGLIAAAVITVLLAGAVLLYRASAHGGE